MKRPRPTHGLARLVLALAAVGALATPTGDRAAESRDNAPRKQPIVEEPSRLGAHGTASCSRSGKVRQVYLGLSKDFKEFTDEERCRTAVIAARERGGDSTDDIIAFARSGIGGLKISSEPTGATIWVNGFRLEGTTLTRAITTVGEKSVKISLPGYAEATDTVTVEPGRWVLFHRDLKKL